MRRKADNETSVEGEISCQHFTGKAEPPARRSGGRKARRMWTRLQVADALELLAEVGGVVVLPVKVGQAA